MKIGTYNIRYDTSSDGNWSWEYRKQDVISQIQAMNADVFGIDEALLNQKEALVAAFPEYQSFGLARDDGVDSGEFNLLFFRKRQFNVIDSGYQWISKTPQQPSIYLNAGSRRIIVWLELEEKTTSQKFVVVVTHLDNSSIEARQFGVAELKKLTAQSEFNQLPVIVVGDFNMLSSDRAYTDMTSFMIDSGLDSDGEPIVSGTYQEDSEFHPHNQSRFTRIDYIFHNQLVHTLGITSGQNIAMNGNFPSDHFPIWAAIEFSSLMSSDM